VTQSVKHPTPDLGSGHDLMVEESRPVLGSGLQALHSTRSLLEILSLLSLCTSHTHLFLSLSKSK